MLVPEQKQPQLGWHYLQVVKRREGGRVVEVKVEVIYGDETTLDLVGARTSYVERTNLTSRHINGRLVRGDAVVLERTGDAQSVLGVGKRRLQFGAEVEERGCLRFIVWFEFMGLYSEYLSQAYWFRLSCQ